MIEQKSEEWKPIVGYEGRYDISNFGRVKSLAREVDYHDGRIAHNKEIILKQRIMDNGYPSVKLYMEGVQKTFRIHKLLLKAFLPNQNNYKWINHIDGDKKNNHIDNLEWCTPSHNHFHAYRIGLKKNTSKGKIGKDCPLSIPIVQMELNGSFIREFYGITEASRITGLSQSLISSACMRKHKPKRGFIWIKKSNYGYE